MMAILQKLIHEIYVKFCLLLILSILICSAAPYEDSSSTEDLSSSLSSFQDISKRSSGINPFLQYFNGNIMPEEDKRALSLFGRWKPQYKGFKPDLGKFSTINTKSEIVTRGGTHVRPLGQPLRWG